MSRMKIQRLFFVSFYISILCVYPCLAQSAIAANTEDFGQSNQGQKSETSVDGGLNSGVTAGANLSMVSKDYFEPLVDFFPALENERFVNAQYAMSNAGYLVTPGDLYTLSYMVSSTPVNYTVLVDTTYRIRIANISIVDGTGKTFQELKNIVENVVSKNYPLSGVQFVLSSPAQFSVPVTGEVLVSTENRAWPLTRLSQVLRGNTTRDSSMRNVLVISSSGVQRRYDLYRAIREGDFTQNPYVRPGDRVVVSRASRTVVLEGGVRRPGLYQLLDGEQLGELIERYGQGVSTVGNPNRIELVRYAGADRINGKKLFVGIQDMKSGFVVEDYDVVRVTLVTDLLPVMYIEGALGLTPDADLNASTSEKVRFNPGENYASLVRARQAWFTSVSDTAHAYVKRGDLVIPMNINPMLYDASYQSEYFVEPFDVLVIPFRQYFVTVAGAVANPGRYPYIPDRDYDYYIGAAGGFNAGQNSGKSVRVFDVLGKQHSSSDPITPETTIEARSNSPLFYFNQVAPVLTTLLTIASTTFTAILTGRSLGWW